MLLAISMPLPFSWPYAAVFWPVMLWVYVPESRIIRRARADPIPATDRGSLRVVLAGSSLASLTALVAPFVAPRARLPGDPVAWFVVGLGVVVAGSLLRRHCFRVLGAFFTGAVTIQPDHRVVDVGAYRWVRHPSYTAALLLTAGLALAMDNALGLALSLTIAFAAYSYRAGIEEQALLASLGDPYGRFLATRKRFVPFVW